METLGKDLILYLFDKLSIKDVLNLGSTNKKFYSMLDDRFWKARTNKDFGFNGPKSKYIETYRTVKQPNCLVDHVKNGDLDMVKAYVTYIHPILSKSFDLECLKQAVESEQLDILKYLVSKFEPESKIIDELLSISLDRITNIKIIEYLVEDLRANINFEDLEDLYNCYTDMMYYDHQLANKTLNIINYLHSVV